MDTISDASHRVRRRHSAELKARILDGCTEPGASVASVTSSVASMPTWFTEARQRVSQSRPTVSEFVPVSFADAEPTPLAGDIRIELRRTGTSISVVWPVTSATVCSAWLRNLLS